MWHDLPSFRRCDFVTENHCRFLFFNWSSGKMPPICTCRGHCDACKERRPCYGASWSHWRKHRHGTTVTTARLSLRVITSPRSRLYSHHGHMRDGGKKTWHNFLHFGTSVPHLTAIQTDLARVFCPCCGDCKQAIQLVLLTQTRCEASGQVWAQPGAFWLRWTRDRFGPRCRMSA